jgi:hypothetical protein
MPTLYITVGRVTEKTQLMIAASQRSVVLDITMGQPRSVSAVLAKDDLRTGIELYTDANCWVDIGPNANAGAPGTDGNVSSFFMGRTERVRKHIDKGDKVSAVAA